MTTDYEALSQENALEYGRAIGRIGKMLLQDRYDKRTHFIYELLQNAEDALRRRVGWSGSCAITFALSRGALRISHYGVPFDESDVRGICGINASTKDYTAIGRFGIGFKSVYAFTTRPEVHSGDESFVIRDYVFPSAAPRCERHSDETVILLPLAADDSDAFDEIAGGLRNLGTEALLFLKHIDEIIWTVDGGEQGSYRRSPNVGDGFMREVRLVSHCNRDDSDDTYLLFSRSVENDGKPVGQAEIAFLTGVQDGRRVVRPVADARLVVFFPTVVSTHTGFIVQGPYQTTPSRDNVPSDNAWNVTLVTLTSELLVEVLRHLRDANLLDVAVLRCIPLERQRLAGTLFAPLLDRVVQAFREERLIPTSTGRYANAGSVRLARAQDVRDLLGPRQLGRVLGAEGNVSWVTADITADRAQQLRAFLLRELQIAELTLDGVLNMLHEDFLMDQSDAWMLRLYRLLATQPALWRGRAKEIALLRLEEGQQVSPMRHGITQAFLPGEAKTGFPTVRRSLCTAETLKFLQGIGLTQPDPVEDVILNLLPKYREKTVDISNYDDDINRMVTAFATDSTTQKSKLISALKGTHFIMSRDAKTGDKFICYPEQVYLASNRMMNLFTGVEHVFVVDNAYDCLRGEAIREMLEACGATRILRTVQYPCDLSYEERREARRAAGCENYSSEVVIEDLGIAGLDELFALLSALPEAERRDRARQLWEALTELLDRRGQAILTVPYYWTYHYQRGTTIESGFIRKLNALHWVPDSAGQLRRPSQVLFEELGWPAHPLLESRIRFKPPAIAALAREVGINPDVLDELKRLGVVDLAQLRARLKDDPAKDDGGGTRDNGASDEGVGDDEPRKEDTTYDDDKGDDELGGDGDNTGDGAGGRGAGGGGERNQRGSRDNNRNRGSDTSTGQREFISYVAVHSGERDPDGLTQEERMALEDRAIARILALEPTLQRTSAGNKGYDLIETDAVGEPQRWVEVKAMTGSLADRPVGMSQAQFEHARRFGDQFWLYIVERADDVNRARILKIRNPFGAAGTFTFDRGWESIAIIHNCSTGDLSEEADSGPFYADSGGCRPPIPG